MALTLLIGGARSGKSMLATELARASGRPVTFLATGEARDAEMAERIRRHQLERPSEWATVEEPHELERALEQAPADHVLIVDCLSLWVANLLGKGLEPETIAGAAGAAAEAARARALTIAVTNEVGLGIVPATPLGRSYRDLLGLVNARWARVADPALLVVAGRTLPLQAAPEPER